MTVYLPVDEYSDHDEVYVFRMLADAELSSWATENLKVIKKLTLGYPEFNRTNFARSDEELGLRSLYSARQLNLFPYGRRIRNNTCGGSGFLSWG